ncbi:MAG: hypothetical protein AAFY88_30530 [Acidobacteriota bacterium]
MTYDEGARTSTLNLATALSDDLYRLFVCGSTSILDLGGNALDGDGDGVGGDDFVRLFRRDSRNQLTNGHFDCDLSSWIQVSTDPEEITYTGADVDESADSGSAAITNLTASNDFILGQCAPIFAEVDFDMTAEVRLTTRAPGVNVGLRCVFYGLSDCVGPEIGDPSTFVTLLADTSGAWMALESSFTSPAGSKSALCSVGLFTDTAETFEAAVDQIRLIAADEIFSDGFEGGNTTQWSDTQP